jgi:hypothetical protein
MDLRIEPNVEMVGLAPKRAGEPKSREDVLLPLSMRERALVAMVGANLRLYERLVDRYKDDEDFVKASVLLLRTFKEATGVSWEVASGFW